MLNLTQLSTLVAPEIHAFASMATLRLEKA